MEKRTDVIVVGGGAAGIAAAVSAARVGVHTVLLEKSDMVGGAGSRAEVGTVCGLSRCGRDMQGVPTIDNPGFAREFSEMLAARSGTRLCRGADGLTFLPYTPAFFEAVARDLLRVEGDRLSYRLGEPIVACAMEASSQTFAIQTPTRTVRARAVIDCSGDAIVSMMLGVATEEPIERQAAGLIFQLDGLPDLQEQVIGVLIRKILIEGALAGRIPERLTYVSMVPGSLHGRAAYFKLGTPAPHGAQDEEAIDAQVRADLAHIVGFLQEAHASTQGIRCCSIARALGVRSGDRGIGLVRLTEDAVKRSLSAPDGVALGFWPIEVWRSPKRPEIIFPTQGASYEIPLGALCARDIPGLYFAGRCISASDNAIASARVMGTCLSTGYAAGYAAAKQIQGESVTTVVADLRDEQIEPFYEVHGKPQVNSLCSL